MKKKKTDGERISSNVGSFYSVLQQKGGKALRRGKRRFDADCWQSLGMDLNVLHQVPFVDDVGRYRHGRGTT